MRLRRPGTFAGHVAWRDRSLFNRPDRLSAPPIEHISLALLGELLQRFGGLAVNHHVQGGGGGGKVVVPDVVVRDLVVPDALAVFEIDADDRIAKKIAAQTLTAIIVVSGR